jgi:hypothetical protein
MGIMIIYLKNSIKYAILRTIMITARIRGGLGNQMFQYAAARALSIHNNDRLRIDPSPLFDPTPWKNFTFRNYALSTVFEIDPPFTTVAKIMNKIRIPYFAKGFNKYYARMVAKTGYWQLFRDRQANVFDEDFFRLKGDIYIDGYFQTEKYFKDYEKQIRQDFTFRPPLEGATAELARQIEGTNAVSLFIRRQEMQRVQAFIDRYYVATPEFYDRAIALIKAKAGPNPVFYISSDEIDWCRKNFKIDAEHIFVGDEHNGPECANAMHLMALCKHFIIPNSSFPWWAAWLSTNKNKVVVGPEKWIRDGSEDTRDILPESWLRA